MNKYLHTVASVGFFIHIGTEIFVLLNIPLSLPFHYNVVIVQR